MYDIRLIQSLNLNLRSYRKKGEIRKYTDVDTWHWIPSEFNPPDDATRKDTASLEPGSRWLVGSKFIDQNASEWPVFVTEESSDNTVLTLLEAETKSKNDIRSIRILSPERVFLPNFLRFFKIDPIIDSDSANFS